MKNIKTKQKSKRIFYAQLLFQTLVRTYQIHCDANECAPLKKSRKDLSGSEENKT